MGVCRAVAQRPGARVRGTKQNFGLEDNLQKTLTLSSQQDETEKAVVTYSRPDLGHLVMEGTLNQEALKVRLRKVDTPKSLLFNRAFHWINESGLLSKRDCLWAQHPALWGGPCAGAS